LIPFYSELVLQRYYNKNAIIILPERDNYGNYKTFYVKLISCDNYLTTAFIGHFAGSQAFISPFAEAQATLQVAGSHFPSLHFVISHFASLHLAGSQVAVAVALAVFVSVAFGPETFVQVVADGHFPQSFETSVAAFLTS
jgi:hypothetical protein